jgi:sulfate adenylyltransferase subunit 2
MTDALDALEDRSVHILREAYASFRSLCMLWSIGKDSTVLLWLARKAFFGHVPFPLVHIDTGFEIPELLEYRDRIGREWRLHVIVGRNDAALGAKETFPDGTRSRLECCASLRTRGLAETLSGEGPRYRLDHVTGRYDLASDRQPWTGVIVGVRADEEGSRSKERYFSPRGRDNAWDVGDQPPEFWNQYKTEYAPGTHVRIHPLLDWTEVNIWEYIEREQIPLVPLYFDQGDGRRYRSLGCWPCTGPIDSPARSTAEVLVELRSGQLKDIAERSGRAQDQEDGGLERLRRDGYM